MAVDSLDDPVYPVNRPLHGPVKRPDFHGNAEQQAAQHRQGHQKYYRQLFVEKKLLLWLPPALPVPLQKGRMPVETVFWILVTSLVSLVTREDTPKVVNIGKRIFLPAFHIPPDGALPPVPVLPEQQIWRCPRPGSRRSDRRSPSEPLS